MKTCHTPILALACCALLGMAGCKPKTGNGSGNVISVVNASTGGRSLHIVSDGGASVNQQENQFTVKLGGHEIVIDRERVLVDSQERAKVPAGAKMFEINHTGGTLTISADGVEVLKTPLAK